MNFKVKQIKSIIIKDQIYLSLSTSSSKFDRLSYAFFFSGFHFSFNKVNQYAKKNLNFLQKLKFSFFWPEAAKEGLPIPKFSKLRTPARFFKVVFFQLTGNVCTWLLKSSAGSECQA